MIAQDSESAAFNVVDRRTGSNAATDEGVVQETNAEVELSPAADPEPATESAESKPESDSTTDDFDERSLPDPTFLLTMATMQMETRALLQALIPIFDGYAWRSMGFIADPKTGETNKDMTGAQLAIDTVQFLLSKVEAQLSEHERRDTHRRLSDLRMNYITKLREP
jgi:hypothetical protein